MFTIYEPTEGVMNQREDEAALVNENRYTNRDRNNMGAVGFVQSLYEAWPI